MTMTNIVVENLFSPSHFKWIFNPMSCIRLQTKLLCMCFLLGILACSREPTIVIDESIIPSVSELAGLNGGPPRPVGVAVEPDGKRTEFVVNEVTFMARSEQELNEFLAEYDGVIVRDGAPEALPYLIQVDLTKTSWDDLGPNLAKVKDQGTFTFSSEQAAKLAALVLREAETRTIEPNLLLSPDATEEHPNNNPPGGFIDWEIQPWMTEDDTPATPGRQGLSIGVTHAWNYLEYKGIPTFQAEASVAIIDRGFALNQNTGFPTGGNLDFTQKKNIRPLQVDVIDGDLTAGGQNPMPCGGTPCPWHGTNAFGVAAAVNSNQYGGAGTGGNFTSSVLFKMDGTSALMSEAIRRAVDDFGVDVINISFSGNCGFWCDVSQFFGVGKAFALQGAINHANNNGVIVVASAGNNDGDLGNVEIIPAELEPVICVGSVGPAGNNLFNFGSSVDIWAPTGILSTVTPASAGTDGNQAGIDEIAVFGGTSASAPFVSGIVALMKALDREISTYEAIEILQTTANFKTADVTASPLVSKGWVDAYRAVTMASPNEAPTVKIVWPLNGKVLLQGNISILARVEDPELEARGLDFKREVVFSESGTELCSASGPFAACPLPPLDAGVHKITATATDRFGAIGSDVIEFEIVDLPPVARINFPGGTETTFCTDQEVCFSGTGYDTDNTKPGSVSLRWRIVGGPVISTDQHFCTTLAEGTHVIRLRVTDSGGNSATDEVSVTILPSCGRPSTTIDKPVAFRSFQGGSPITFKGKATDPEDGTINDKLVWYSDIDGKIGEGEKFTTDKLTSPLGEGLLAHTIKLVATDSEGNEGSTDQIVLLVGGFL